MRLMLCLLVCLTHMAQAEISINNNTQLSINNGLYDISQGLGQTVGSNLFHTFDTFNLNQGEIAQFSGSDSIQNIISRVIGGEASSINGTIRSTILDADFYFLNPYGIVFGEHARLDLLGSFHASTADYLKLSDGGEFHARFPEKDILTTAPIASFGFLNAPKSIALTGYKDYTTDQSWENRTTGLHVPEGESLSLIGGDLEIKEGNSFDTVYVGKGKNKSFDIARRLAMLSAPSGRLNLVSIASQGEVELNNNSVDIFADKLGYIRLAEHALIHTDGEGGGRIFIRGEQLVIDDSTIVSKTLGNKDGQFIDVKVGSMTIKNGGEINATPHGIGRGSDIRVEARETISIEGENASHTQESGILMVKDYLEDEALGDTGNIDLVAKNVIIKDGAGISNSTNTTGNAGKVTIKAEEDVLVTGDGKRWEKVNTYWDGSYIASATYNQSEQAGQAGDIEIQAKNISFTNGSYLFSDSAWGEGGKITLNATEKINFSGEENTGVYPARVYVSNSSGQRKASDLLFTAKQIEFKDGSFIDLDTKTSGDGGHVELKATDEILFENASIYGYTQGKGNAGDIFIQAGNRILLNDSYIQGYSYDIGNAGKLSITANNIFLKNTTIDSDSSDSGSAGVINIEAPEQLQLTASSISNSIFSSGKAGGIIINAGKFFLSERSGIYSDTLGDNHVGNISITANELILKESNIYNDTYGKGDAGELKISVTENMMLDDSWISSDSLGEGDGKQIEITTKNLRVENGSYVSSIAFSSGSAGGVNINATDTITITGEDSKITSNSTSTNVESGEGGKVQVSAKTLVITDQGSILTNSYGGSQAGEISINVGQLELDSTAQISSENSFSYIHGNADVLVNYGDMITINNKNDEDMKVETYLQLRSDLVPISPLVDSVVTTELNEERSQLDALAQKFAYIFDGYIVENTQSERFVYISEYFYNTSSLEYQLVEDWVKIKDQNPIELDEQTFNERLYSNSETRPPKNTLILVKNSTNNKVNQFVYTTITDPSNEKNILDKVVRLTQFLDVDNEIERDQIAQKFYLQDGDKVNLADGSGRFIYYDNNWIKLSTTHEVDNQNDLAQLALGQAGNEVMSDNQRFIYSGTNWVPLTKGAPVPNLTTLEQLQAKEGIVVSVEKAPNGQQEYYFYAEGEWILQKRGSAGKISITAQDVQLSNGSKIITDTKGGNGGDILLNVDDMLYLNNSEISVSVDGGTGNGGDLTVTEEGHPQLHFLVANNNSKLFAQAIEGRGGDIQLTANNYLKSSNTVVNADSELGVSGSIRVDAPEALINEAIATLPEAFLKIDTDFQPSCESNNTSHFTVIPKLGISNQSHDWVSAH